MTAPFLLLPLTYTHPHAVFTNAPAKGRKQKSIILLHMILYLLLLQVLQNFQDCSVGDCPDSEIEQIQYHCDDKMTTNSELQNLIHSVRCFDL